MWAQGDDDVWRNCVNETNIVTQLFTLFRRLYEALRLPADLWPRDVFLSLSGIRGTFDCGPREANHNRHTRPTRTCARKR